MSNWTVITPDHLRAAGYGGILDKATAQATAAGTAVDPIAEEIADAVARVRRAVSSSNDLDANAAAVPNSLKGPTIRLALVALMRFISLPLSTDEQRQADADQSDLKRIFDAKIKVEKPDTAAANAEMQPSGRQIEGLGVPCRQTGRGKLSGL